MGLGSLAGAFFRDRSLQKIVELFRFLLVGGLPILRFVVGPYWVVRAKIRLDNGLCGGSAPLWLVTSVGFSARLIWPTYNFFSVDQVNEFCFGEQHFLTFFLLKAHILLSVFTQNFQ